MNYKKLWKDFKKEKIPFKKFLKAILIFHLIHLKWFIKSIIFKIHYFSHKHIFDHRLCCLICKKTMRDLDERKTKKK